MKNKAFHRYYLFSCLGVLLVSLYPLYMGIRVVSDMLINGTVLKENYPKYIIPYTPIAAALIIGVLIMPLCFRLLKRFSLAGGACAATAVFFALELLFERRVVITDTNALATLEDWQMYMCYVPTTYKLETALDILMGEYDPAFKLHFYIISLVLILALLNCLYGFGQAVKSGSKRRIKSLVLQSVCTLAFLGLCILACFTAFWRDGNLRVSPLSASLMTVFFVLLGVTSGVFAGSFLLGKGKFLSVWLPSLIATGMTLVMYMGEMILLSGHLYSFGASFLFRSIPGIVLAPVDLAVILAAGGITAGIFSLLNCRKAPFFEG